MVDPKYLSLSLFAVTEHKTNGGIVGKCMPNIKVIMKAPPQLKTLADLMAQAGHYAEFCMRRSGTLSPTLFLIGTDGPMMFQPATLANEQDKDDFANAARLVCIAHDATACVMTLEAWLKTAQPGEELDLTEPPSEAMDRQEVIVLMGEDRSGQRQQFLSIIRSDNGKFFGFNEVAIPTPDTMTGRFRPNPPAAATESGDSDARQSDAETRGSQGHPPGKSPTLSAVKSGRK